MRSVAALVIAAVAALAFHRVVIIPWRCNDVEGIVGRATDPAELSDDPIVRARAERNVALLARCIESCKTDVNLAMLGGANLVTLGRLDAAARLYEQALQYEKRPELYLALGFTQADLGQREKALENVVRAVDFTGDLTVLEDLSDPIVKWRATEIVGKRRERYLAASGSGGTQPSLIDNRSFDAVGPNGANVTSTGPGLTASAAARWELVTESGTTVSRIVRSTRRPGDRAMLVKTTAAGSGIRQVWPGGAVPRVTTIAWVFVKRGRVAVGSGRAAPMNDAYSTKIGQWERLEGVNQSCPASMTMIQAVSEGGAEFLVDQATARYTITAPPCNP